MGGGRIVNGQIDKNSMGFEVGHQIIDADVTFFPQDKKFKKVFRDKGWNTGSLTSYISGSSLKIRYGKDPEEIVDEKIWEKSAEFLAIGLNNTIVHWSPDIVVLGGSMMNKIPIEKVRSYLKNTLKIFLHHPEVKKAELGDLGGLYGALALLKQIGK